MLDNQKQEFFNLVKVTFEVYNQPIPSQDAIKVWWSALSGFDLAHVRAALDEHIRKNKFSPKPSEILETLNQISPDGRPGADEAWSMIPRDEYTSAVMTEEMAEAMHVAQPLLDEGDQVAARMAFKEAYTRIVDANKRANIKPKWFASLGWDKEGREPVLTEAVRLGRLSVEHATLLLPSITLPISDEIKQLADKMKVKLKQEE